MEVVCNLVIVINQVTTEESCKFRDCEVLQIKGSVTGMMKKGTHKKYSGRSKKHTRCRGFEIRSRNEKRNQSRLEMLPYNSVYSTCAYWTYELGCLIMVRAAEFVRVKVRFLESVKSALTAIEIR